MGYQPKTRPELLYPPGNPNVYCGDCSAKIEDDMYRCPECGKAFVSRWQLRPPNHKLSIVLRPYEPSWLVRLWQSLLNSWGLFHFDLRPAPYIEEMARSLEPDLDAIKWPLRSNVISLKKEPSQSIISDAPLILPPGVVVVPSQAQSENEGMQHAAADWRRE